MDVRDAGEDDVPGILAIYNDVIATSTAVYREDLKAHPHNGWALLGLAQALGTKQAWAEYEQAWARADVKPPASVY